MSRSYRLVVKPTTQKDILGLQPKIRRQIEAAIDRLLATLNEGQRPQDIKPLAGRPDHYRIDSGEYRILFQLDEAAGLVRVFRVGHRKDVYRNL